MTVLHCPNHLVVWGLAVDRDEVVEAITHSVLAEDTELLLDRLIVDHYSQVDTVLVGMRVLDFSQVNARHVIADATLQFMTSRGSKARQQWISRCKNLPERAGNVRLIEPCDRLLALVRRTPGTWRLHQVTI